MIWKIIVTLSVALCAHGGEDAVSEQRVVIHHKKSFRDSSASHIGPNESGNQDEYAQAYPSYEFSYNVNDPKTRDIKGQHEIRDGEDVKGNYWLIEPNGRKRTVHYQANDNKGFNAQINYTAAKEKQREEAVSQYQVSEQSNVGNDNEGIEVNIQEEIRDILDNSKCKDIRNDDSKGDQEQPSEDDNKINNQRDEPNNTSNVESDNIDSDNVENGNFESDNIDRNENESQAQSSQQVEKFNSNIRKDTERRPDKPRRGNRERNNDENRKREKLMRYQKQSRVPPFDDNEHSKNNHDKARNTNRVKENSLKLNENKNRRGRKAKTINGNNSLSNLENKTDSIKKEQSNAKQEKNEQKKDRKNYAIINFAPSNEDQKRFNVPNNEETYEHRIRIYHPKNIISPKSKDE